MGLAKETLYATNIDGDSKNIFLSAYIPEKRNGEYYRPKEIPLGYDMWIPNVLDLKIEDGTIQVEVIESEKETGLWLICEDGDFLEEQWLKTFKPKHIEGKTNKFDYNVLHYKEDVDIYNTLHIYTEIDMKSGDCIDVTLKRVQI